MSSCECVYKDMVKLSCSGSHITEKWLQISWKQVSFLMVWISYFTYPFAIKHHFVTHSHCFVLLKDVLSIAGEKVDLSSHHEFKSSSPQVYWHWLILEQVSTMQTESLIHSFSTHISMKLRSIWDSILDISLLFFI